MFVENFTKDLFIFSDDIDWVKKIIENKLTSDVSKFNDMILCYMFSNQMIIKQVIIKNLIFLIFYMD